MSHTIWQTTRFQIDLSEPKVMAIVNITPDSFSDGGQHHSLKQALQHAEELLRQGADILDIGGESSRPGAQPVSTEEELSRVLPFVKEAMAWQVPISIDTYKPEVMEAALDMGADIINDIWALRQAGALDVVARHGRCGVCLMHMHRDPLSMHEQPMTGDAVSQVSHFLGERVEALRQRQVSSERLVLDPGIGFGKTDSANISLLLESAHLSKDYKLAIGVSRKGFIQRALGELPAKQCDGASKLIEGLLFLSGVSLVRTHDVKNLRSLISFIGQATPGWLA